MTAPKRNPALSPPQSADATGDAFVPLPPSPVASNSRAADVQRALLLQEYRRQALAEWMEGMAAWNSGDIAKFQIERGDDE